MRNSNSNRNSEAPNGFVGLTEGNTHTRVGCETKALSIAPVKVKGRGKGRIATLCTEQLLEGF